jgi:Protein of unknown function DUF262/HNH endonuclease
LDNKTEMDIEEYPELEAEAEAEEVVADKDDQPVVSQPYDWTISALREKYERGQIDIQPTYQREYVWALKPELPSRLIESLLLEIPIPPMYFGKISSIHFEVIDGQQRLTTLIEFVSNRFPLQKLQRMSSLNGKKFCDLSEEDQSKILDATIRTVVIDARHNHNLRYEVFERLNRGSMALNEQELRNCVYRGPFCDLLAKLEKDPYWRKIKGSDKPEPRFIEREMILRFFSFTSRIDHYKGNLKRFLNDYMADNVLKNPKQISELENLFLQTMQNLYIVFGPNAGRLYSIGGTEGRPASAGKWDTKFSISAFDIQASALIGYAPAKIQALAEQIREAYIFYILTNPQVRLAISRRPADRAATKLRWFGFKNEVQNILNNVVTEPRFFSLQIRQDLYAANPVCAICKNRIHSFEDCVVDHIQPYIRGGKTILSNAQLAHRSCNAQKYMTSLDGMVGEDALNKAHILLQVGYIAAAGALAGLELERHLKLLCSSQQPSLVYGPNDGISKVNDILRKAGIYDQVQWRQIQVMADVRNTCDHPGINSPSREDVNNLVKDVQSLLASFPV